jgi:hypothetical protein
MTIIRDSERVVPARDLDAAVALIADLAALVEAGLVAVDESLVGPARYRIGDEPGAPLLDNVARLPTDRRLHPVVA